MTDDRHQPNINDHQSCDVTNFIVEIRSLNKGKKSENGDEYKWDEDGKRVHDRIFVEGDGECNNLIRAILALNISILILG